MPNEVRIAEIITLMAELYGKTLSRGAIGLYCTVLAEYPIEKIEAAAANILKTHKYATIPKPAEFIEFIEPPDKVEHNAAEALRIMEETMIIAGSYQSIVLKDTVLQSVIQYYGGWPQICDETRTMDDTEYSFFRKEFTRLYKIYSRDPRPRVILLGRLDMENRANGFLDDSFTLKLPDGKTIKQIPYSPDGNLKYGDTTFLLPGKFEVEYRQKALPESTGMESMSEIIKKISESGG